MEKPFAITLDVGSSLANKTGSWRTSRPVYVDRLPPCNNVCPAGENIQAWLFDAEEGGAGYERAWRKIMEENPFPAIMGRVCSKIADSVFASVPSVPAEPIIVASPAIRTGRFSGKTSASASSAVATMPITPVSIVRIGRTPPSSSITRVPW